MKKYTTAPYFTSPLWIICPASQNRSDPEVVLGRRRGRAGILPYAGEVYKYMRLLEKASRASKWISIGTTEEGREMIAVAVTRKKTCRSSKKTAPAWRSWPIRARINSDDSEADKLVAQSTPVYYITGTIHSPETGAPTSADGVGVSARRG